MNVLETDRLTLRRLTTDDAEFIFELVNDRDWLQFIGDKGVKTLDDARTYITNGPIDMYTRFGFGLYLVELKECHVPIGLCGLIRRDTLDDVDIGYAFLPKFRRKGYAIESASAVMEYGRDVFDLHRIVAITSQDNDASRRLLEKLGMRFEGMMEFGSQSEAVRLYAWNLARE